MDDYTIIQTMIIYGGGFASALGKAAQRADLHNLVRIKLAFPELWEQYAEMAKVIAEKKD